MVKAGAPLLREALEAIRTHRDAQDGGAHAKVLGLLRLLANSFYHAGGDFQFLEIGRQPDSIH